MTKYYIAIADIHGDRIKLDKALADVDVWIELQQKDGTIKPDDIIQFVFLGDYIDRGHESKYVLAKVEEYVHQRGAICLIGNHDQFLLGTADGTDVYFEDRKSYASNLMLWLNNGGMKTCVQMFGIPFDTAGMNSMEIQYKMDMHDYIDIIKKSPEYSFLKTHGKLKYETDLIFFCHAQQSDPKKFDDNTLIWGRQSDYSKLDSAFKVPGTKAMSVHGHYHRLSEGINFPRIEHYVHGGKAKTVIMADCGCGCGTLGALHPVIIAESSKEMNGIKDYVEIVTIL
jgi:hypothetical protein